MPSSSNPGAPGLDSETWEGTSADAAGFVLAGGRSSRMGTDKALVQFAGRALIEHAIEILQHAGLPVHIAGAGDEVRALLPPHVSIIPDSEAGRGPLAGICAALRSTTAPYAVFLPVDTPMLPPSLIRYLLRHARLAASPVTVASVSASPQTFPAVLARDTLPFLERKLHDGELGCLAAFQAAAVQLGRSLSVLPVELLVQSGQIHHPQAIPALRWFLNINSRRDLHLASSLRTTRVS
jgi:molybdopterin-guanine dinucleotide biosynthesis protein A